MTSSTPYVPPHLPTGEELAEMARRQAFVAAQAQIAYASQTQKAHTQTRRAGVTQPTREARAEASHRKSKAARKARRMNRRK